MGINSLRTVITVLAFIAFVGIVVWAWNAKRKSSFEEAAQLPFDEGDEWNTGSSAKPKESKHE